MVLNAFHPTIARWFREKLGEPTAPQRRAWPAIRSGQSVLVAAPTGSGKTLAAFLAILDQLAREGGALEERCRVLYVSPLRALASDVQKNLVGPLGEMRALDPSLPEIRVLVRSGDTPQSERQKMVRRPPHVLVTTPESLYILLGSKGGRGILKDVRTVIADEVHAVLGSKRGAHLALSLERLEALTERPVQRIGLSATQKPLDAVGRFLMGPGRRCELVDEGHLREMELSVEVPPSPLEAVCSHETWGEINQRIAELVREHRTTLIFVGTRKLSERLGAQLAKLLSEDEVASHHSSLSKERRLEVEGRLKGGDLRALVATASLELGIDIGDVDLVIQVGAARSIAAVLQRVGRSGHGVGRRPKGVLFPLAPDELVEAAALLKAIRAGRLDRTPVPSAPLDVLAQQLVAECVAVDQDEQALFELVRRSWPYRELAHERFEAVLELHASRGRRSLLHRDKIGGRVHATRAARIIAVTSGGAIPDNADYRVVLEPEGTTIGTVNEDFAIESSAGDIFQLGNASWRVLKTEPGIMRVADAQGAPPSLPFWFGEAPARTRELSEEIAAVREHALEGDWLARECDLDGAPAELLRAYLEEGREALGVLPTQQRIVLERFFDEAGGTQLVIHAPYGGRINRALGLALRKRFCRRFGFELQAAANEDAIVISLGPQHSFPLDEVLTWLSADSVRDLLVQALLATPMFTTRWRWNTTASLLVPRFGQGRKVPAHLLRMRADDLLVEAFPEVVACGETLPGGDLPVPEGHPLIDQTLDDCLHGAMDVEGLEGLLRSIAAEELEVVCVDTPEPSAFARSILSAGPYAFLDDAPLEERRARAVQTRRALSPRDAEAIGALDEDAVERVKGEAWPDPRSAEEVHESLSWMGFVTAREAAGSGWEVWLAELQAAGRAVPEGDRWFATDATRDPKTILAGRLEALGPVHDDDPLLFELETEGRILRTQWQGRTAWCDRRLLARIHRYTLDRLRREIRPVAAATYLRFLADWQLVSSERRGAGSGGVLEAVRVLSGYEAPILRFEKELLARRVGQYKPEWLDELGLSGQVAWARLWGASRSALRSTPITLFPREEATQWLALAAPPPPLELCWPARAILEELGAGGALFANDLVGRRDMLGYDVDRGLAELVSAGLVASDSFASLRRMLAPPHRWKRLPAVGRWFLLERGSGSAPPAEFAAKALLRRWGVVFRAVLERERLPVPWRDLLRTLRAMELAGDVRGGRFVDRFAGEQYALPEAIPRLRAVARAGSADPIEVAAADPLNLRGILTPDERVASNSRSRVSILG